VGAGGVAARCADYHVLHEVTVKVYQPSMF